jgi:c-di-GMP-binding flagellar brake protein YcgR
LEQHEKRRHPRVPCEVESSYRNAERPETTVETLVKDISEGGIRFRATRFIPVKEKLKYRIRLPNRRPIEAVARPAWIREIPSLSQYDIGAQFLSLSEADRQLIRQFVQGL